MKLKVFGNYLRDGWNIFDLVILLTYFCAILPLRIVTWASSETETNNRALLVAGYLYGFNMMFLTFRTLGSILEIFEGVGTIQIALFHIIKDAAVIVLHFIVITLGFSSTITKVLVSDNSVVAGDTEHYNVCNKTGITCWLEVTAQLGLSLLELSDGLDFFKSTDLVSQTLSRILFAAYLIVAFILLINMLIALLSNTYQRVQDNSRKEWAFQKAVTVQTYHNFHPIPVPFNIISIPLMALPCLRRKTQELRYVNVVFRDYDIQRTIKLLQEKYRLKFGDSLPPANPLDQVLDDTSDTVGMLNQVLYGIFTNQRGSDRALLPNGPQAWDTHDNVAVDGFILSCTFQYPGIWKYGDSREENVWGAIYRTPFSPRSPHFEIMMLEAGYSKWLCLGVVFEDHSKDVAPGFGETGTVGFDPRAKRIYDSDTKVSEGKRATGPAVCRRGDTIRLTLMFGNEQERDGKVQIPVVFTVNGSRLIPEGNEAFIEYNPDKPLYPYIAFRSQNSVLAKMVMKEDLDNQDQQLQEVISQLTKTKSELIEAKTELRAVKTELSEVKSELESKLVQVNESLGKKLDSVLAKLQ